MRYRQAVAQHGAYEVLDNLDDALPQAAAASRVVGRAGLERNGTEAEG
jgi:hypothetical protein